MRTRSALPAAALALLSAAALLPASAGAACAPIPLGDLVTGSKIVATAEFLPGATNAAGVLLSPAKAKVRTYDQGKGPAELDVLTASGARVFGSEGIAPRPGEVWRLYGSLASNGSLGTSICAGSVLLSASAPTATISGAGAPKTAVAATTSGKPHSGALQVLKLPKSGKLAVKVKFTASGGATYRAAQVAAVRLITPGHAAKTLAVKWSGGVTSLSGKLPKLTLGKKGATLVVVTRDASFAVALRG